MEKQLSIEETIELTNNIIKKQVETWGEKHPAYELYENMKGAFPTTGTTEMDPIPHEEGMPNIEVTYTDNTINALRSLEAFMSVANQHRPYEPSDFEKEYFIPDNI